MQLRRHLKKMGFVKKRDGFGTYIIADSSTFDEIVAPISPQLVILSTLSTLSTQSHINNLKNSEDGVKMNVDNKNNEKEKM